MRWLERKINASESLDKQFGAAPRSSPAPPAPDPTFLYRRHRHMAVGLVILDYLGSRFFFIYFWSFGFLIFCESIPLLICPGMCVLYGTADIPGPLWSRTRLKLLWQSQRKNANKSLGGSKSHQLSGVVRVNTASVAGWGGRPGCGRGQINDVPLGSITLNLSANEEG